MFPFPFSFFGAAAEPPELELIDNNFAMEFDTASSQYISSGYNVTSGNKTISFWFNSSYAGYQCVLGNSNDSFILGTFSSQIPMPNGVSYTQGSSGKTFGVTASVTDEFADGNWHHFVYTYDGNSKIYIDGTERTISYKSGTSSSDDIVIIDNLGLGLRRASYPFYDGDMDEVAIWSRALDDTDVQTIYNATNDNPGKCANLWSGGLGTGLVYWNRMGD